MNSITIGMVTKNSSSRFGRSFETVLSRTKEEVPFQAFLVADQSVDETPDILKSVIPDAIVLRDAGNRAEGRQAIIDATKTEWLMFVDDDIFLEKGWLESAQRHIDNAKCGMVWGPARWRLHGKRPQNEAFGSIKTFSIEGGTQDSLFRMEALRGCYIPSFLDWREDTWLARYVKSMGFTIEINSKGFVHLKSHRQIVEDTSIADARLKYSCEKQLGTFRPRLGHAISTLGGGLVHPGKFRKRLEWAQYYAGLYPPFILPSVGLSHRWHLPVFKLGDETYKLWNKDFLAAHAQFEPLSSIPKLPGAGGCQTERQGNKHRVWVKHKPSGTFLSMHDFYFSLMLREWFISHTWDSYYLPMGSSLEGKTVLDVGAGEGETAFFYLMKGAAKVICVETFEPALRFLRQNVLMNHWPVEIIGKTFSLDILDIKHDFMKMDIDGGESALLETSDIGSCSIETHEPEIARKLVERFSMTEMSAGKNLAILRR